MGIKLFICASRLDFPNVIGLNGSSYDSETSQLLVVVTLKKKWNYHFTDLLSQRAASHGSLITRLDQHKNRLHIPALLLGAWSTEWYYVTGLAVILLLLCITIQKGLWWLFLHIRSLFICECFKRKLPHIAPLSMFTCILMVSQNCTSEGHLIVFHNFLIALIWSISILSTLLVDQK